MARQGADRRFSAGVATPENTAPGIWQGESKDGGRQAAARSFTDGRKEISLLWHSGLRRYFGVGMTPSVLPMHWLIWEPTAATSR